ncbi:MAG TPA: tetratricopeptide repeat protein, partial [Myxococcaceae bacterium]|nr:tetratricopeptide repeat protein [Myxococcaceae bacterium]
DMGRLRYLGYAHGHLGQVLFNQGELDGAMAHFQAGLDITERLAARDPEDRSLARWRVQLRDDLANLHLIRHETEAARRLLDSGRAILDPQLARDPDHRDWRFVLAHHHKVRSSLLAEQGQWPGAVEQARRAVAVLRELASAAPERRDFATGQAQAWWQLGYMHERAGALEEARAAWRQGLELCEALARQGNEPLLRDARARLLLSLDRAAEAKPDLEQLGRMGYREVTLARLGRARGIGLAP